VAKSQKRNKIDIKNRINAFVKHYIKHYNATQAAIAAGYSPKSADNQGWRMMKNEDVQKAITEAERRLENKVFITKEKILKELALIGFSSIDDHIEIDTGGFVKAKTFEEMPTGAVRCIKKIKEKRTIKSVQGTKDKPSEDIVLDSTFEFELYDKVQALINMGKEFGMFRDRKEIGLDDKTVDLILAALPKDYADAVRNELMKLKGE
jgi:phage terminase small subunit